VLGLKAPQGYSAMKNMAVINLLQVNGSSPVSVKKIMLYRVANDMKDNCILNRLPGD